MYFNEDQPSFFPDFQVKLMISPRSKSFRLVSEQRRTENGIFGFGRAIFGAVFDSRPSFFAAKPQENACYAG